MIKICGVAMVGIAISLVLKSCASQISVYVPQITALIILVSAVSSIIPIFSYFKAMLNETSSVLNAYSVIITASVITLLSKTVSDICSENGHQTLKNAVEFAGNAELALLSLPLIKDVLNVSQELFGL